MKIEDLAFAGFAIFEALNVLILCAGRVKGGYCVQKFEFCQILSWHFCRAKKKCFDFFFPKFYL
jgi:hypothetical protein